MEIEEIKREAKNMRADYIYIILLVNANETSFSKILMMKP